MNDDRYEATIHWAAELNVRADGVVVRSESDGEFLTTTISGVASEATYHAMIDLIEQSTETDYITLSVRHLADRAPRQETDQ